MRHQPHIYIPPPWDAPVLNVGDGTQRHLTKALRYSDGAPVTYTDGQGVHGTGVWIDRSIARGDEHRATPPPIQLTLAVAPPHTKERQRFVVEKVQELGVAALRWVQTAHTQGRAPRQDRAQAWAVGALEQSRGAWLVEIDETDLSTVTSGVLADADASTTPDALPVGSTLTVVVGPEGGMTEAEAALFVSHVRLAGNLLRTETAAIVAAASFLS